MQRLVASGAYIVVSQILYLWLLLVKIVLAIFLFSHNSSNFSKFLLLKFLPALHFSHFLLFT